MDYYKILGVERNATEQDIKQAYRRQAAKHHPDRGGDTQRFQEVEEAYRNLSDPQMRQRHDNPQPEGFPGGFAFNFGGPAGFSFEEIFQQTFNRPRHRVYTVTVFVTLEKVATGDIETIQVQTPQGQKTFQIAIPKGIEDGQRVNYENLMPDGILQISFRVHQHPRFERRRLDLILTQPVSVFDLILGTTIQVETILGKKLDITIPPRTKPGSNFRIPNHGLEASNAQGDQYVLISPVIPDTISEELLTALQKEQSNNP